MTVDQAWGLVVAAQQTASASSSSQNAPAALPNSDAGDGVREKGVPVPQRNAEVEGVGRDAMLKKFLDVDQEML